MEQSHCSSCACWYVHPVSDDGGSPAEIVRVLGRVMFPTMKFIPCHYTISACVKSVMMVNVGLQLGGCTVACGRRKMKIFGLSDGNTVSRKMFSCFKFAILAWYCFGEFH